MKWTHVCPLLGVTLLACATGKNDNPSGLGLGTGADNAGGSTEMTAGSAGTAGTGDDGTSGTFASGGTGGSSDAGGSNGGTFSFSGTTSFAGTFSSGGVITTAGAGGAASGAGGAAAGAGGKASGGAAGAGGKASGGAAGAGGSGGNAMCVGTTIPAKTTWKGSAMPVDGAYPAAKVFDGDNTTRFSSGTKQVGGEWLEIDFGEVVTINEITMFTNNGDYFRHYQLRMSNTSGDFAAPILKEADGVQGSIVVPLAKAQAGQYLTIKQTGADAVGDIAWWSLHELSVACK